jgi:hypothetical protein
LEFRVDEMIELVLTHISDSGWIIEGIEVDKQWLEFNVSTCTGATNEIGRARIQVRTRTDETEQDEQLEQEQTRSFL